MRAVIGAQGQQRKVKRSAISADSVAWQQGCSARF